jgi:hypothetical protein
MASTTTPLSRWTQAKLKTIEALADLYCATPKDIAEYLKVRKPSTHDIRGIRATLDRIQHHDSHAKYLSKKPYFMRTSLYGLNDSGVHYAREILGFADARAFEIKDPDHEHLITRFHVKAMQLAHKRGWEITWKQEAVDHRRLINPDAVMTLGTLKGAFVFPVEPERQSFTENHLKKGKKYFDVYGKEAAFKQFGAEKIRPIFITLSHRKRDTMLEKFAEEYPYRMFWFTTVDDFERDISGKIFLTPKDYKTTRYSFLDL